MTPRRLRPLPAVLLLLCLQTAAFAQAGRVSGQSSERHAAVPTPESVIGFRVGEDRRLAKWEQFLSYFRRLALASDRIKVEELGKTTLGRPFIVATISSADNLRRLDEFKEIQRQLADPRLIDQSRPSGQGGPTGQGNPRSQGAAGAVNDLIRAGKTVVAITCSIHSTEVGGTFMATELAYRLASENSPEVQEVLNQTIILLVPSLNPDGTDIVADWYRKTVGTPAEGTSPPELYHHYTGHDNNRDWYAFTQVETQLTVDKILNAWRPQIVHDVHQQGAYGSRLFVPPYVEPWEPNIDPALIAGVNALGSAMAWEVLSQGKSGVVFNGSYDAWTPARAYAHYHAGLRILSETASARLASPIEVPPGRLGQNIGFHAGVASWNFPKPWPGGRWTLRDIIDYQGAAAFALLAHAARHRERYLRNFYEVGRRAVEHKSAPYAFLLPEPEVPASIADAAKRLGAGMKSAGGTQEQQHSAAEALTKKITNEPSTAEEVGYYLKIEALDRLLAILKRGGVEVFRADKEFTSGGQSYPAGTHVVPMRQPYAAFAKTLLENQRYPDLREYPGGPPKRPYDVTAHTLPLLMNVRAVAAGEPVTVEMRREPAALVIQSRVRSNTAVRVGLYQNYAPSMDEGWTRWVFDQYKFPFTSIRDADLRAGNLHPKFDVVILPDQSARLLADGTSARAERGEGGESAASAYPPEYAGGMGAAGVKALRDFVEAGGTLIALNNASNFAIERLGLPVRNVLQGVGPREFYCPGSILRTRLDETSALAFGLERESIAWFEGSPAFEATEAAGAGEVRVVARYPESANPLLSGWILGDQLIRGKAALVEAKLGKGRVVLFGFRPQYRGQSLATFPLLFNAILTSKAEQ